MAERGVVPIFTGVSKFVTVYSSFVMEYLFENPRPLIALAMILEAAIFVAWKVRPDKVRPYWLLAGVVIIAMAILADRFVTTDRESLEDITRQVVRAAEDEDAQTIIDQLSGDFRTTGGLDKATTAETIRWHLAKPLISGNYINELIVKDVRKDGGSVELEVTTNIDPKSIYALWRVVVSRWRFDFVRDGDSDGDGDSRYRISHMVMLRIADRPGIDVFNKKQLDKQFR